MKKLCIVAGTRPNLIKVPPLLAASKKYGLVVDLVDTGQHYDHNMQQIFYDELQLPESKRDIPEDAECVIVIGDTNSTVAGAFMACERGIPLAHVEAGCRCWNRRIPEEVNRIVVDALSDHLFCPTPNAAKNVDGIFSGDVLYDMFITHKPVSQYIGSHVLVTIHRADNTKNGDIITKVLSTASEIGAVIFPVHPRTRPLIDSCKLPKNVCVIDPVSYGEMLRLIAQSICVFTDSGGVQREAYWSLVPFHMIREETEWPETLFFGNQDKFGDGKAAYKIMEVLANA